MIKKHLCPDSKIKLTLVLTFIVWLTGCVSSRLTVPGSSLPVKGKYYYVINSGSEKYYINTPQITNGSLTGRYSLNETGHIGNKVIIYASSDSAVTFNENKTIGISSGSISNVEVVKLATGRTILLVIGSTLGFILLLGALSFNMGPLF